MRISAIQNNNINSCPCFRMRIVPSDSVKYAVLTSRNLMDSLSKEQNREFVQNFCDSLARVLKSKQAEMVGVHTYRGFYGLVGDVCVQEYDKAWTKKTVLELTSIQENEHKFGNMMYSQEGGNAMRALIEYAKTIKDVSEQKLNLTDKELQHYAYKAIGEDLHNGLREFNYPEAGCV